MQAAPILAGRDFAAELVEEIENEADFIDCFGLAGDRILQYGGILQYDEELAIGVHVKVRSQRGILVPCCRSLSPSFSGATKRNGVRGLATVPGSRATLKLFCQLGAIARHFAASSAKRSGSRKSGASECRS